MSVEVERAELLQEVRRRRPCLLRVTPRASARHGGRTPGMAEDEPDAGIASEDAIADGQVRSSCRVEQEFSRKRRDARHRGAGKCGWVDEYTLIAYSGPKTSTSKGGTVRRPGPALEPGRRCQLAPSGPSASIRVSSRRSYRLSPGRPASTSRPG